MEEKIKILSDKELMTAFSDDAYKTYMKEIQKYPLLSVDEQKDLARKYRNGDKKAGEKLIQSNLKLVISVANRYGRYLKHMQVLDIIQEGNLGLMRALQDYDPSKAAFTTYALYWIDQKIRRFITDREEIIRKPVHVVDNLSKYRKLLNSYQSEGKPVPSDDEICEILHITKFSLNNIKETIATQIVSINTPINEEGSDELGDLIPSSTNQFDEALNEMNEHNLYIVLKEFLSPFEYFVIYHRILREDNLTLEQIASYFKITRERVRQVEAKVKQKLKPYLNEKSMKLAKTYEEIKKREKSLLSELKIEPLDPYQIIGYLYLKDDLDSLEEKILSFSVFGKYNFSFELAASYLDVPVGEIKKSYESLKEKMLQKFADKEKYEEFKLETIEKYQTKIFLIKDQSFLQKEEEKKYENETLENILELFQKRNYQLTLKEEELLTKFFADKEKKGIPLKDIIIDVNVTAFGYKYQDTSVPKEKLYKTYLKNKEIFNEEQQLFLESVFFEKKSEDEFQAKYPNSNLPKNHEYVISRLERCYYHILNYFENSLSKEIYIELKKKYPDKIIGQRAKILDLYYGVEHAPYSLNKIAEVMNIDYQKAHDLCRDARDYVIRLLAGMNKTLNIEKSIYQKYLIDPKFHLSSTARQISEMYFLKDLSYEEIKEQTGLSKTRISNTITDTIRKMDRYRFHLTETFPVNKKDLEEFFKIYKDYFVADEKNIIYHRFIDEMTQEELKDFLRLDDDTIKYAIKRFKKLYISFLTKNVAITKSDIEKEIKKHPSESLLTNEEKLFATYSFGIDSRPFEKIELMAQMKINNNKYWRLKRNILEKVKGQKIGLLKADLSYISRDQLNELLEDKNLPIKNEDKEIICYLFELKGYPYKTLKELKELKQENEKNIKRKYQNAIINIYKYQNKELAGSLDYEIDICPLLKYFSMNDQMKIEDYYKNGLTYEEMTQKYGLTINELVAIMSRIKIGLFHYMNQLKSSKIFDFDFYTKATRNPELPFYGDLEKAIQIFDLAFGMDGKERRSVPEIIKKLQLNGKGSTINQVINELMLSVCKLQDGIKKERTFSFDEVSSYYNRNVSSFDKEKKRTYLKFLNQFIKNQKKILFKRRIPYEILNDLIEEKYKNSFSFTKATRKEVIHLLRIYGQNLDPNVRDELMAIYEIKERNLMKVSEKNQVYELLNILESKKEPEIKLEKKKSV